MYLRSENVFPNSAAFFSSSKKTNQKPFMIAIAVMTFSENSLENCFVFYKCL